MCAFQAEILRAAGYRVGRFTSPFLIDPSDSIQLDGNDVDREMFEDSQSHVRKLVEKNNLDISSFELLTAVAFDLFSRPQFELDLAVVEVGLGGEMDATNVCESQNTLLSCITPISIDHQAHLGSTVREIATHKAGIARPQVPILLAQQSYVQVEEIVRQVARNQPCDMFIVPPYPIPPEPSCERLEPLPLIPSSDQVRSSPSYPLHSISSATHHSSSTIPNPLNPLVGFQHQNAATATTMAHLLRTHPHPLKILPSLADRITNRAIVDGLKNTKWPGRLELRNYKSFHLLLDGAHNQASAQLLGDYINSIKRPITLIISMSSPRDPIKFIDALGLGRLIFPPQVIATSFSIPKDMHWVQPTHPEAIINSFKNLSRSKGLDQSAIRVALKPQEALELAASMARDKEELIVICGSLYLISDVLKIINHTPNETPQEM